MFTNVVAATRLSSITKTVGIVVVVGMVGHRWSYCHMSGPMRCWSMRKGSSSPKYQYFLHVIKNERWFILFFLQVENHIK